MKILLLGSGGREHALAWKIAQSPKVEKLFIAPGNAGTGEVGENVNIKATDFAALGAFALEESIDMIVVGPEDPLVEGIYDHFQSNPCLKNIAIIGPSKEGARLEGSKEFAKEFMHRHHIPTARYQSVTADTLNEGLAFLETLEAPYVLKADGLCAGKGVLILPTLEEAKKELKEMLGGMFGNASATVVIEEFLSGIECSAFVLRSDRAKERIAEAEQLLVGLKEAIAHEEKRADELSAQREKANEGAQKLENEVTAAHDAVLELTRETEAREGELGVLRAEINRMEKDVLALSQEEDVKRARSAALDEEIAKNERDALANRTKIIELTRQLSQKEEALQTAQEEAREAEEKLEAHKSAIIDAMNRLSDVRTSEARLSTMRKELERRGEEADAQREKAAFRHRRRRFQFLRRQKKHQRGRTG